MFGSKEEVMPSIRHELKGEIRVIFIDEVRLLEGSSIDHCYREIVEVLEKTEEKHVLLHFGRVTFMSSSALGMLIRVNKKCRIQNHVETLQRFTDIRQVFKITGLDKILEIHADPAQAMEAFKKSGQLSFRKQRPSSYEVT